MLAALHASSARSDTATGVSDAALPRDILPYNHCTWTERILMTPTRTERLELRADPEAAERIRRAASVTRKSVSAFVLDAANEAAERVMADQSTVVMPPEVFDSFYRWLDTPAEEIPALARLARRERRIVQR